jgi:hypothetical protein
MRTNLPTTHDIRLYIGHHEPSSSTIWRLEVCRMSPRKSTSRSILLRDYATNASVSKVVKSKSKKKRPQTTASRSILLREYAINASATKPSKCKSNTKGLSLKQRDGMLRTAILARSDLMVMYALQLADFDEWTC